MRVRLAKTAIAMCAAGVAMVGGATPAGACAGLVAPNGTIRLLRTATLAAYHNGYEHYVTSFQFAGDGAELGSIVPLPGVPSNVERGGDWTLQRLDQETHPQADFAAAAATSSGDSGGSAAEVVYETTIDALDITILKGGGSDVGKWAVDHGFALTPDAPETLDFYSRRSPIFMAARFDAAAARERGQSAGDGTPIHLTIPTDNPWVPLRILGLGRAAGELVEADVYLLTDRQPALLPDATGVERRVSAAASEFLLDDLRSDKGMEWMPARMWLTYLAVNEAAGKLRYDLAVDATGRNTPSFVAAGLRVPGPPAPTEVLTPLITTTTATTVSVDTDVALPVKRASHDTTAPMTWFTVISLLVGTAGLLAVLHSRAERVS